MHTGETTMSTVRRPSAHRAYLREVSRQTTVLHLQGFLFFGTITRVEETIRALVTEPVWVRAPIRFLVLDFALVLGVDLSAAEAFVRVQRLLSGRNVALVICGAGDGKVRRALESVGLLDLPDVEFFITFNDAMECEFTSPRLRPCLPISVLTPHAGTENVYLRAWFDSSSLETKAVGKKLPIMLREPHICVGFSDDP
jgi:SulP family sulfate permease